MYKSVAGGEALISEIAAQEDQEGIVVAKRLDAPYRAADLAEDQEQGSTRAAEPSNGDSGKAGIQRARAARHAHCEWPGISADERQLVIAFLTRDIVWCSKARHFGRLRNASICSRTLRGAKVSQTSPFCGKNG